MSPSASTDIVSASILRSQFEAVVAEMQTTLLNTACSPTISVAKHCATAVFTEQGQLIAVSNPLYLYPMAMTAARLIDYFLYDLSAEDVLLTNDPYAGGTRVQDFTLLAPVASGDSISLFVAACGRTEDFAGDIRGNLHPRATEIWAEGALCSPIRLVRDGKLRKDVLQTLKLNSRSPDAFALDIDALRAAAVVGRQRLIEMLNQAGPALLASGVEWILDYSERRMRALIERIPRGRYRGQCMLGHDAHGDEGKTIRVAIEAAAGKVSIDFSGTDAQSKGFMNATRAVTSSMAVLPLLGSFGDDVPCNAGALRCIDIVTPDGTLVNPRRPAPVGWGLDHVGTEIAQAVTRALEQALPGRVGRAAASLPLLFSVLHQRRHGRTVEQTEVYDYSGFGQGDCDATAECDGWGMPGISARVPLPSIELYESDCDGVIDALEFLPDSAGAGRWRGSPGTRTIVTLRRPPHGELHLTAVVVPRDYGDGPVPAPAAIRVDSAGQTRVEAVLADWTLPSDATITLDAGGGLGWGAPHERPAERVAADVANGLVSIQAARDDYGVVLDPVTYAVDRTATARLRHRNASALGEEETNHG